MKHRNSATSPVQLLISYKSTPTSNAAYAVNKAVRSAADSDVLHAVDSAVGQVFYSAVYQRVYIRTWCAVSATWRTKREIHFEHNAAALGIRDRQLPAEITDAALGPIAHNKHIEIEMPVAFKERHPPKAAAPGKRGKPQPWEFTIAQMILGGLLALAIAQFEPREPEKPAANSPTPAYVSSDPNYGLTPTPRPAATPAPLANVPAIGKVIEHGGGYWQWDGQQWKPVPRAIPLGR